MTERPFILICAVILMLSSCGGDPDVIPRPRQYPKVEYPERDYTAFNSDDCPFAFSYPDYFNVVDDKTYFGEEPAHPCWFDLYFDAFDARIHCSYYPITAENSFDKMVKDAFRISNKINQRSNFMDEIKVANAQGVGGLIMEFQGPAASPMHFYLTDTTEHFFKASLYFNTKVRPDSLQPVTEFIKTDIAEIINSFEWD